MTIWFKVENQFQDHPSMIGMSMAAIGLWTCGLAYCSRFLTDGFIPERALFRICPQADAETIVAELVEAGRWEPVAKGWQVASYLEHNPSRERVVQIREARSAAGSLGGEAKAAAHKKTEEPQVSTENCVHGKPLASCLAGCQSMSCLDIDVDVDVDEDTHKRGSQGRRAPFEADFETFWDAFPRKREKGRARTVYVARRRAGVSAADLLASAQRYAEDGRKTGRATEFTKHPATFLNNGWEDWLPGAAAETERASGARGESTSEIRARLEKERAR